MLFGVCCLCCLLFVVFLLVFFPSIRNRACIPPIFLRFTDFIYIFVQFILLFVAVFDIFCFFFRWLVYVVSRPFVAFPTFHLLNMKVVRLSAGMR